MCIPRRPRWPSPCMYAALLLHTYTAFSFFEDSATQREGERGPRGAKLPSDGEGRDAEKRESPRLIKNRETISLITALAGAGRQESAACHSSFERAKEGERDTELQATPSSSQLCWPLASHRQVRTFAILRQRRHQRRRGMRRETRRGRGIVGSSRPKQLSPRQAS